MKYLKGNSSYKSKDEISAIKNVKRLYNEREKVVKFYNYHTRMVSEAKYKSVHGEAQVKAGNAFEGLSVHGEAQVKACNAFEGLLNEIRQMIYSL